MKVNQDHDKLIEAAARLSTVADLETFRSLMKASTLNTVLDAIKLAEPGVGYAISEATQRPSRSSA